MSNYSDHIRNMNDAYHAGRGGRDFNGRGTRQQISELEREFERGKMHRTIHSQRNNDGAEGLGALVIFIMLVIAFIFFYSPFIALGALILYPFTVTVFKEHSFSQITIYLLALSIISYLFACWFQYLRGRLIQARLKNRPWRRYFFLAFLFRVGIPAIAVYCISMDYDDPLLYSFIAFLFMAYKIRLLDNNKTDEMTQWALKKGEKSIMQKETLEYVVPEWATRSFRVRLFYLFWLLLSATLGTYTLYFSFNFFSFPGIFTNLVLSSISFGLAGYFMMKYTNHISNMLFFYNLQYDVPEKVIRKALVVMVICISLLVCTYFFINFNFSFRLDKFLVFSLAMMTGLVGLKYILTKSDNSNYLQDALV